MEVSRLAKAFFYSCFIVYLLTSHDHYIFSRQCPLCTSTDVEFCLMNTAEDLGEKGRDQYFGVGLLQTSPAFDCLLDKECCAEGKERILDLSAKVISHSSNLPSQAPSISPSLD